MPLFRKGEGGCDEDAQGVKRWCSRWKVYHLLTSSVKYGVELSMKVFHICWVILGKMLKDFSQNWADWHRFKSIWLNHAITWHGPGQPNKKKINSSVYSTLLRGGRYSKPMINRSLLCLQVIAAAVYSVFISIFWTSAMSMTAMPPRGSPSRSFLARN